MNRSRSAPIIPTTLRWIVHLDMPEVLALDHAAFGPDLAWSEEDLLRLLRRRSIIGKLLRLKDRKGHDETLVSYILYRIGLKGFEILRLATDPAHRRRGHAQKMVADLLPRLDAEWRPYLYATVPETNLAAAQLFRACGFRAALKRDEFGTGRDGYRFVYDVRECQGR